MARLRNGQSTTAAWIDGHLDLAYIHLTGWDIRREPPDASKGCVSLPALRSAGVRLALATIFTEPGPAAVHQPHGYSGSDDLEAAEQAGLRQIAIYDQLADQGHLRIVRTAADLTVKDHRLGIVLLMEGADPIRSPDHLPAWHARGLRIIGLTWASGTRYAGGNGCAPGEGPLTALGRELVAAMDHLGMVHDASHLSDRAFDDVMACARGPVIASHSNCRALLEPKQRHVTDRQISEIAARDGIVGLNLCGAFLAEGRRATIADCVNHVQHVAEVMGHRRGVALGSDMDGGFTPATLPEELDHPSRLPALALALRDAGWPDNDIAGFTHRNWTQFLQRALPPSSTHI